MAFSQIAKAKMRRFSLLIIFLLNVYVPRVYTLHCALNDQSSLLQLKHNLVFNSDLPSNLNTWNSTSDCCAWEGVTCNPNGEVIELDFSQQSISGGLNSSLFDLHHLQRLDLSFNDFNGTHIPHNIGKLVNLLHLDLSNSGFGGQVPLEISTLTSLLTLNLAIDDDYPNSPPMKLENPTFSTLVKNLKNLTDLDLGGVDMSVEGEGHLWGMALSSSLPGLQTLRLSKCSLSGPLHESLVEVRGLTWIDLSGNYNLSGELPDFLADLSNLTTLYLYGCGLHGSFPKVVLRMQLQILDLSDNLLLSGTLPVDIGNMTTLISLFLSNCTFSGSITHIRWENLENLSYLYLRKNVLNGSIPSSLFSLPSIIGFDFSSNHFNGQLGNFSNASSFRLLDLSSNKLEGPIPTSILNLASLANLDLSYNNFSGTLDLFQNLGNLTYLAILNLKSNMLQGQIPITLGNSLSNMQYLSLSDNNFNGTIPLSLCNIGRDVEAVVDLSDNSLSGIIPPCLLGMNSGVLNLKRNLLSGSIPDTFRGNCSLETLDLSENLLHGTIPKSMVNCRALKVVNLGNNGLSGGFPCWMEHLSNLTVLVLRSNRFYGPVKCDVATGGWSKLQIIDICANGFGGELPYESFGNWVKMMSGSEVSRPKLDYLEFGQFYQDTVRIVNKGISIELEKILIAYNEIDFSCNHFEGLIPRSIGDLTSLYTLNLSHNRFTGPIPPSIGNLTALESLDLASNGFTGVIPEQLASLTFISYLNLSFNHLVGKIPTSTQLQSFSEASYTGNKGLYGPPMTMDCANTCGPRGPPVEPVPTNDGKKTDWELIISIEVGFVIGLGSVLGSLMFWKRWRIWYFVRVDRLLLKKNR